MAKGPQCCSFLVVQALIHQLSTAVSEMVPCVRHCTGSVMDTVLIPSNCIKTQELELAFHSELKLRLRNSVRQDAQKFQTHGRRSVTVALLTFFFLPPPLPPSLSLLLHQTCRTGHFHLCFPERKQTLRG